MKKNSRPDAIRKAGDNRKKKENFRGILSVNSRAVGFLATEKDDIRIETEDLRTALNKDEVEVELIGRKFKEKNLGRVVRIIKRAKDSFVGTIEIKGTRLSIVPDDFKFYSQILVAKPPREAKPGLKALVKIKSWKPGSDPEGDIVKVIGEKGTHETEIQSIILDRGFESGFPPIVEAEAEKIASEAKHLLSSTGSPIPSSEISKRRGFREATLFTIDPASAKDFDDAISIEFLPNGNFEIGIHIADVSHYVREGTELDQEGRERGTSVYMVDRTVPMLPNALSDDLCSLNPNVDRLAFSAVFEMTGSGKVLNRWFGRSVINSKKRFTYESAQETILKGGQFEEELRTLDGIAKKLRDEKMKKGAIDFEHEEVGFELDASGKPIRVFKKTRLDTHKLVEEFMLLANREVAEFFFNYSRKTGQDLPFLYRIHDLPNKERMDQLRVFVHALGHELPMGKKGEIRGKDLQVLFQKIEGKAEESLIKTAAVRSMAKAIYSTKNIGHFGLAFEYYTHFTSPIRRYPDLMVHRLLDKALKKQKVGSGELDRLSRIAEKCTEKEISASEAERESVKLKQVEFMQTSIGKEFDGMISGVTEWGVYIEEDATKAEGMCKLKDLPNDYYVLDADNYSIIGERTKRKFTLGDKVRFKLIGSDVERKTLDYRIV